MRLILSVAAIAIMNSSLVNAGNELEIQGFKLGAKLPDLYQWVQQSCEAMTNIGRVIEESHEGRIKICALRNDVIFKVGEFKVEKAVFRFIDEELFHAAFDFRKNCKCYEDISQLLLARYGFPMHPQSKVDLIRHERRNTRITFHQLSGIPRLWWHNIPLLIKANSLISKSDSVRD